MRAIEFKSKIQENKILIPRKMQPELNTGGDKMVRVVVFMDDSDVYDERAFRKMTKNQFLKGYAESDSVYDI
ncbi:MAG: glycosyltransferase family 43 protein [Bacteroidales bacterium]|nr:glycosyltransferase family 43 protein [Bacteroidales bacterium]